MAERTALETNDAEADMSMYAYPAHTPGAESTSGFYFNLTSTQREQLRQTRVWMEDEQGLQPHRLCPHVLATDLTLLRYLRANKFDVDSATQHISRNMAWREDGAVNTILELSPEEILGCPVKEYQRYLPTWQRGFDRTGRPVVYKQYGFFENALLRDVSSIEAVTRYHVWEQEVLARLCYQQSRQTGLVVETSFAIMDLEGMAIRQVTKDFLAVVKAYANIDQTQYPETLGKLMIINAPSAFPYVWSWVKPWLDPVVASKIQIFGGPSTWQPVLFDLIGKENMPANYGGDLPRLTIDEHPYPGFEKGFKVAPALSEPVPPSPQHGRRTSDPRRESRRGSFRRAPSIGHAASGESYSSAHSNSNLPPTLHSTPSWEGAAARPTTLRFGSTRILSSPVASPLPLPSSANRFSGRYICNETNPLRYPPNTPGHDAPDGYVFSLTEKQTTVLKAIQQWMQDEQIDVNMLVNHALHPNLIILRYLRANKFDEEMSIAHMKRNIVWRKENGVLELNDKLPDEILGCSVRAYMTFLPHWQCGFDKTGRPVVYKRYGSFENTLLQDHCSLEAVTRYHIWEQEILCKLCHIQSRKRGQIVETSFAIMDLEGMAIRQVTSDFLSIVKAFAAIDQAQYPETLGKLMIINAPSLFPYVWRGVKSFLDPVVTSKIQIFGGPSTWQPVLFDLIGKENMPANYGGDLPMLTVSTPPYPMMSEPRPKSTRKIMPDGFDLERCCEEEYGNGSNGDNDGEETQSVDSSVFYDAVEQQEVNDVFNIVSQRERFMKSAAEQIFVFRFFTEMEPKLLSLLFFKVLLVYLMLTFIAMVLSAYAIHSEPWIMNAYASEKWTAVIIVLLSFVVFVVIFIGYLGEKLHNHWLVNFFAFFVAMAAIFYGIVSVAAFSYYGRDRNAPAMNDYRLVMGIGCLLMFILSFAPIVLARASSYRFKLDQDRRLTPQQLRVVIRSLNLVLVLFAVGMVSYGGTAMTYLFSVDINIASAVYSVYGLIYCGVTILLAAICGFWVSITTRRNVVKFYSNYLAPLVFTILLAASIVSFVNLGSTNDFSSGDFKSKNVSIDTIKSELSTELLISGILCIFCAIFLLISRWVCVRLYMNMDEDYGAGAGPGSMEEAGTRFKYGNTLTIRKRMAARNWREWLLITYGLVGGLFCIYFKGSFVVFADFVRNHKETYELNWVANFWFGGIDHRYLDSNAYILASEGALAIVVGPLMLLYAWSTFVRAPFRHIVGVITTTAQVYSAVIYYGIEIRSNFRDISGRGPGIMAIAIIFDLLVSVILPIRILWSESAVLSRICSKAYSNDASKLVRKTNRKPSSATLIRSKSFMSAIPEETERLSNSKSSLRSTYSQRASPVDAALLRRRAPSGSSSPFEKSPSLRGAKFDMIGRLSSGDQTQDVDGPRSSLNTANTSRHEDDFEDFTMTI